LFVFIGLALLAVLLLQFSRAYVFPAPTYDILLNRRQRGGLKTRAQVLMSGPGGTVAAMQLAHDGKSVTIHPPDLPPIPDLIRTRAL